MADMMESTFETLSLHFHGGTGNTDWEPCLGNRSPGPELKSTSAGHEVGTTTQPRVTALGFNVVTDCGYFLISTGKLNSYNIKLCYVPLRPFSPLITLSRCSCVSLLRNLEVRNYWEIYSLQSLETSWRKDTKIISCGRDGRHVGHQRSRVRILPTIHISSCF
jgi:hypothetical protein